MIPMEMTAPSQGMNSNILAGLTGDILKKVTKNITETVSAHATDALQQGVPYGHILEQLISMSPVSAGMAIGKDMSVGGGGKPPQQPSGPGQQYRPPQPPQPQGPTDTKQDQPTQPGVNIDNSLSSQSQQPQGLDGNTILSQLLAAMQNGGGQQMNMPSFLGIKPSAQNQVLLTEAAKGQQALAGKTPMQIGDLQKIIAGVGGEQLSANTVPLNAGQKATKEYQDKEIAAKTAQFQLDSAKEQMTALNQEQERATSEFNAMANSRGWLAKGLTPKDMISQYKSKLDDIGARMDEARKNLITVAEKHPILNQTQKVNSKQLIGKTIGKYKVVSVK